MEKEKFVTPVFRGSFVYLNEPHAPPSLPGENPEEKYSITVVMMKDDKAHMAFVRQMRAEIHKLLVEKFGDPKIKKYKWTNPIKDGDNEVIEQWENAYILQARSSQQPAVVNTQLKAIMEAKELYAGAHYRASITLYPWKHPTGGIGVSFSLSNVMKVKDDDAFDGRTTAEDDFADVPYEDDFADEGDDDGLM